MSSAIDVAYKNASIPKDTKEESNMKLFLTPKNSKIMAIGYPTGFFVSNGYLYNMKPK